MIRVVQIVGFQRSGTNWLTWLLKEHCRNAIFLVYAKHWTPLQHEIRILEGGQPETHLDELFYTLTKKHKPTIPPLVLHTNAIDIPMTDREPYAPVESLPIIERAIKARQVRYAMIVKHPVAAIRSRTRGFKNYRNKPMQVRIDSWVKFHKVWMEKSVLLGDRFCFVRHKALLEDTEVQLKRICESLNLEVLPGPVTTTENRIHLGAHEQKRKSFDADYYLNEDWWDDMDVQTARAIHDAVPHAVMDWYGYSWGRQGDY